MSKKFTIMNNYVQLEGCLIELMEKYFKTYPKRTPTKSTRACH